MPNVVTSFACDAYINCISGSISKFNTGNGAFATGGSSIEGNRLDNSLVSNQYINNLNEVRVKSIISIGYIKLY